jgi:hypothetical protein
MCKGKDKILHIGISIKSFSLVSICDFPNSFGPHQTLGAKNERGAKTE